MFGELPDLPLLPELPDRGPGADMIGRERGAARRPARRDRPVRLAARGAPRPRPAPRAGLARPRPRRARAGGRRVRRHAQGAGRRPVDRWPRLELPIRARGGQRPRRGARPGRLAGRGAAGAPGRRRAARPRARVVLQLDEPSLPAVLAGQVPTPSGYGTVRSVAAATVRDGLRAVLEVDRGGRPGGALLRIADAPFALLRDAGADALSVDLATLGVREYDSIGGRRGRTARASGSASSREPMPTSARRTRPARCTRCGRTSASRPNFWPRWSCRPPPADWRARHRAMPAARCASCAKSAGGLREND